MGWTKTEVKGTKMWEDLEGQRLKEPFKEDREKYGWTKVTVNGRTMWESPDGERSY